MTSRLVEVSRPAADEAVHALEDLLAQAKAGQLTGFIYVAMHSTGNLSYSVCGRSRYMPVYALGMADILKTYIQSLI